MLLKITEKHKKGIELNKEEIEYNERTAKRQERIIASYNDKVKVLKSMGEKTNGRLVLEEKDIKLIAIELVASELADFFFSF